MQAEELLKALREALPASDLKMKGWVNYSGLDVLQLSKGGYYLMGLNPALDSSNLVLADLQPTQSSAWSAFTDVCWQKRHSGGNCEHKLVRHQKQVVSLANLLGLPVNEVFGTNAIFFESCGGDELLRIALERVWLPHWRIHQKFLTEMRPKMIICLGHGLFSSFGLLKLVAEKWELLRPANALKPKRWDACDAVLPLAERDTLQVRIVALPHPSRNGDLASSFAAYAQECSPRRN